MQSNIGSTTDDEIPDGILVGDIAAEAITNMLMEVIEGMISYDK